MLRLVMDTDVMVAAIRSDAGASRRLLTAVLHGQATLLLSVPLLIEYEAILTRAEHLAASGLTAADIGALLDAVAAIAEPVRLAYLWRPQLRDPNDDMVLETAIDGGADRLVTFNLRHFATAAEAFGLTPCRPAVAVRDLETPG
jgi:putative PIN family toxin of toxin-antitoxin system